MTAEFQVTTEWRDIKTAPDDFNSPGGQRPVLVRDKHDKVYRARRGYFNNSGWVEMGSNRELWPTQWKPLSQDDGEQVSTLT